MKKKEPETPIPVELEDAALEAVSGGLDVAQFCPKCGRPLTTGERCCPSGFTVVIQDEIPHMNPASVSAEVGRPL